MLVNKATLEGMKEEPRVHNYRLPADLAEALRERAFYDRRTQTDIVKDALSEYLARRQKPKGRAK